MRRCGTVDTDNQGEWLRLQLERTGISQAELGRRIGLHRNQINRLILNRRRWNLDLLGRICCALSVEPPVDIPIRSTSRPVPVVQVGVMGMIGPGHWYDRDVDLELGATVPAVPDRRFPSDEQKAFRVDVDLRNDGVPLGAYVITIPMSRAPQPIREGALIVATRERAGLLNYVLGRWTGDLFEPLSDSGRDVVMRRYVIGTFVPMA